MTSIPNMLFWFSLSEVFILSACIQQESRQQRACEGVFLFDQMPKGPVRDDAAHTILQFVELDAGMSAGQRLNGMDIEIKINSFGSRCETFGWDFTHSDMPVFRGLRYKRIK